MRAISLWQPFADLWLSPAKVYETRHWSTRYRGPLLVHAAKRRIHAMQWELHEIYTRNVQRDPAAMVYGAIIGRVELIDCVSTNTWRPTEDSDEFACGNWEPDRFGWKRAPEFVRFATPIPYIGRQGFFTVPDELLRDARAAA